MLGASRAVLMVANLCQADLDGVAQIDLCVPILQPGTSALLVMVREADREAVFAALEPFQGEIYSTHLPADSEEALHRALR